jgi:ribosomal protein S2
MKSYVYKRNKDGIHYLDISKTWEKLMVAARVIAAISSKNPKDVLVSILNINIPLVPELACSLLSAFIAFK